MIYCVSTTMSIISETNLSSSLLRCYQLISLSLRQKSRLSNNNHIRQVNYFNKLMEREGTKKKQEPLVKESVGVAKGVPSYLMDKKGVHRNTVSRRTFMLNKNFAQCITDVFSTEEVLKEVRPLNIRITEVNVSLGYTHLNIYWTCSSDKNHHEVASKLKSLTGILHQRINDRHFTGRIPHINFILDVRENHMEILENVLKNADFGDDFVPSDATLFATPYETLNRQVSRKPNSDNDDNEMAKTQDDCYSFLKIKKPAGMRMDLLGLDYEQMINTVLINLKKSRAQHRAFNAVADPLPPPDWAQVNANMPYNTTSDLSIYDTDERIKQMKMFLIENRKKKQRVTRDARKAEIMSRLFNDEEMNMAKDNFDDAMEDNEHDQDLYQIDEQELIYNNEFVDEKQ